MSGFFNVLDAIGGDPRAWIVFALFAARAAWSVFCYIRHPTVAAGDGPSAPADDRMLSLRFLLLMLTGIVLAVAGLFRLALGAPHPALALFLLLLGIYLFTTEPVRRQIAVAENKVRAVAGTEAEEVARVDLRDAHIKLVAFELSLVALLLIGMLAL